MKTILVIDDSQTARHYHQTILVHAGFRVLAAEDGSVGLEMLFQYGADVVITDVNMARMNGYEFIERVRREQAFEHTPIIIISTETGDADKRQGYAAGANLYLTKPCMPDILVESAKMLMS